MKVLTILALLLTIPIVVPQSLEAAEITFRSKARVSGELVRLEDIARVRARNKEEEQTLAEVLFGESPESGQMATLEPSYLRRRLEQFGFWGPEHRVTLPEKAIMVRRSEVRNRVADVEEALRILVQRHFDASFSRVDIELADPEGLLNDLPKGLISIEALDLDFVRPHSDSTHLALTVQLDDNEIRGRFPVEIRLWRKEVHAARILGMREDIREKQLKLIEVEVTADLKEGCTEIQTVAGHRLRKLVAEGRRVLLKDVLPELAITKNQMIRLEQRSEGMSMIVHARALDDGRQGEEMLFEMKNGSRVKARITGKGAALLLGPVSKENNRIIVIGDSE